MSDATTRRMIRVYEQIAPVIMFLTGFFQSPPENFYDGKEVEFDIIRSEEDVSIAVTDLSTGYRMNEGSIYTNKSFIPPVHKEAIALDSIQLLNRMPGATPFENPVYRMNLLQYMYSNMVKVERKIRRAIELQASQVLQTGTVTLSDESGTAIYTLDYSPKTTHFPTSGTTWGQAGDDKLGDLESLMDVILGDGLTGTTFRGIFGQDALREFLADETVQAQLDNRRMELGGIVTPPPGKGGKYHGVVSVGPYTVEIWSYVGRYKHPQTGTSTRYIDPAKVVLMAEEVRLDATFGGIPNIGKLLGVNGPQLLPELPARIANDAGGMDLHPNVWLTPDGEDIFGGVGARPLLVPTAIDQYGCLDTGL